MHFYFFILLPFLTLDKDYRPLAIASLVTILQHIVLAYFQLNEISFFGIDVMIYNYGCSYDIALLHAFFVILEWIILYLIIKREIANSNKINEYQNKLLSNSINIINENLISSKTDLKGKILEVSEKFCEISKYSKDELVGKNHNIVRHPDMPKELFKELWETIKSEKVWHGKIKNITKNGDIYWVDTTILPEYDYDNNHIGYSSIRHDITNEIKVKELLEKVKSQQSMLVNQTKHAAMGEMISMIAHQWRQPLTILSSINTKLNVLFTMNMLTEEKMSESMNKSRNIIDHLSQTINDFRNFFHKDSVVEDISIQKLVSKSISIIGSTLKDNSIEVFENYDEKIENIKINIAVSKFTQVLLNLLKNALDVIVENEVEKRFIKISAIKTDKGINICVEDSGGGISDEIIGKIFEPYFSTKSLNGTGLGLYMSKLLVEEQLESKISVKNGEKGAIFTIELSNKLIVS